MTTFEKPIRPPVDSKNPNYYLDKDQMRDALRKYRDDYRKSVEDGVEAPRVPEYLGECFLNISKGLAMKHNFRHYSFVNDMIMDGVMTCLKYIKSFDPDKISERTGKPVSPLSYFTQTCFYSFINRINEEEEEAAVKWELLLKADIEAYTEGDDDSGDFKMNLSEFIKALGPQKHIDKKKQKTSKKKEPVSPFDDLV